MATVRQAMSAHPVSLRESMDDLFGGIPIAVGASEPLDDGAVLLRGLVATDAPGLLRALEPVLAGAPFRHMITPGGHAMSVAMTNCGRGVDHRPAGYRYDATDPETGRAWPAMPPLFLDVAARAR